MADRLNFLMIIQLKNEKSSKLPYMHTKISDLLSLDNSRGCRPVLKLTRWELWKLTVFISLFDE